MKSYHSIFILLFAVTLFAFCGCEGSQEPTGPAGLEKFDDGLPRRDASTTRALDLVNLQYYRSGHALGAWVEYAGGRAPCARCHSHEGLVEYAETGDVEANIPDPTPFYCNTCHNIQPTDGYADYGFRIDPAQPTPAYADGAPSFDFGDNSNLCANCHQARRWEPGIEDPGETYDITSVHWGPHHGAQANVFQGTCFAEIPGPQPFGVANPHLNQGVTCVFCHMAEATDGTGGHTWRPSENTCHMCHDGGFDFNGVQSDNQERMDTLRDLLVAAGVMEIVDDTYEVVVGTYPMVQAQAYFNWKGLDDEGSLGVHNPPYVKALLINSIEALQPVRGNTPPQPDGSLSDD